MTFSKTTKTIKKILVSFSLFPLIVLLFIAGCENNPNDLGLSFVNPLDTTGSKILDTTIIVSSNYRNYINSNGSANMLVGNYNFSGNQYTAKTILKYNGITTSYQNARVLSANLRLRYSKYAFKDTTGTVSFNIYKVNRSLNPLTITNDSVSSSDIGTTSIGSYTGNPADASAINIALDTTTMKDWLNYAADTSYSAKNYGLAIVPNSSSTTIKGFYSENNTDTLRPFITLAIQTSSSVDTVILRYPSSVSLSNAPVSVIPSSQYFLIQNGVSFRDILKFSFPNLPSNVIINEAYLQITINSSQSFITSGTSNRIKTDMVTDSSTKASNDEGFYLDRLDSITYAGRINQIAQRWNSGVSPNYGLLLRCPSEGSNLDYFIFYNSDNTDISKRPKMRIRYTLRQ